MIVLSAVGCHAETNGSAGNVGVPQRDSDSRLNDLKIGTTVVASPFGRRIDAGVVLADRESYLLIPVEKLPGFPASTGHADIRLSTSCECVEADLLEYTTATGQTAQELELRFRPSHDKQFGHGRRRIHYAKRVARLERA